MPVLLSSIQAYVPSDVEVYLSIPTQPPSSHRPLKVLPNAARTFGEAYNLAVHAAFEDSHTSVVLCNDDVVLTPSTWATMLADVELAKTRTPGRGPGYVAARSDFARGRQNIRTPASRGDPIELLRYRGESMMEMAAVIAPIFAWISKQAWIDFPPLNWYSDDLQCYDILTAGYPHWIGTSYVHHVGAQTCGLDAPVLTLEAQAWLRIHRPDAFKLLFDSSTGARLYEPPAVACVDHETDTERLPQTASSSLPRAINLGSGADFRDDCINIDRNAQWKPDIVLDVCGQVLGSRHATSRFGQIELTQGSFDLIRANHVLEHVPDLVLAMRNCLDLLRPDGEMHIVVPYDLSYGAWQDPTHLRAFNERSFWYFSEWHWYLDWRDWRFETLGLHYQLSDVGVGMQAAGTPMDVIARTPRAVDGLSVVLKKIRA